MRRTSNTNKSAKSKNNGIIIMPQDIVDALDKAPSKFIPFNKMEDAIILKYRQKDHAKSFVDIGRVLKRNRETVRIRYIYLSDKGEL